MNLVPSAGAIQTSFRRFLDAVLECAGDTPDNRAWAEDCLRYDPRTIGLEWWEQAILRCSGGTPEAIKKLLASAQSVADLFSESRRKPTAVQSEVVTPPLPKLGETSSRKSVEHVFGGFDWGVELERAAYSDGFGSFVSSRTSPPIAGPSTVLPPKR
jgi:hypothetical protein